MSNSIAQVVDGLRPAVKVSSDDGLATAYNLMLEHGYSQLPVEAAAGDARSFYLITAAEVLGAVVSWGQAALDGSIKVRDIQKSVPTSVYLDDQLFDVSSSMRELGVALVLDKHTGNLQNIITSYDIAQFFVQRSKSIMEAQGIEEDVKECVRASFRFSDGTLDEVSRQAAIDEITSKNISFNRPGLLERFRSAIQDYITLANRSVSEVNAKFSDEAFASLVDGPGSEVGTAESDGVKLIATASIVDSDLSAAARLKSTFKNALSIYCGRQSAQQVVLREDVLNTAFKRIYNKDEDSKSFNDLTLKEFTQLFLSDRCWNRCEQAANIQKKPCNTILDGVRETRNKLAHFRDNDIRPQDREQLQLCSKWLTRVKPNLIARLDATAPDPPPDDADNG